MNDHSLVYRPLSESIWRQDLHSIHVGDRIVIALKELELKLNLTGS